MIVVHIRIYHLINLILNLSLILILFLIFICFLQISDAIQTSILILVDTNRDNMLRNVTQIIIITELLYLYSWMSSVLTNWNIFHIQGTKLHETPSPHPIY